MKSEWHEVAVDPYVFRVDEDGTVYLRMKDRSWRLVKHKLVVATVHLLRRIRSEST